MIHVDESEPIGELEPCFPYHDVTIKRGIDAKEFYDLITEIGRGKFGTVYKCQEKSTGLQLAAKFIPIPKREDRRNVEREVEIMSSLQHSKIIQLYDAYEFSKNMWVILELIEGGELFERVIDDDFILTERACIVIIRQVCEAIEFVHRNNILHLDMKPENILCLTKDGNRIKIIDFGLARKYDPDKKLQVLFGTPEFVAPEVVNFDRISFGTDMWSVGVICYVLLSGLSPFMGENDIETMANVTISKYDFDDDAFNDVSKDGIDFITKLLVKDISTRLTATDCLEHIWLKRRLRPQVPPKPVTIPPTKLQELTPQPENEVELEQTKDNLREFVERWGEHPNSPYVFDSDINYITPIKQEITTVDSNMSSRGCSPSPCESLSSERDIIADNEIPNNELNENLNNTNNNNIEKIQSEIDKENSDKDIKDYLQTFERRNSDSKYVLKKSQSLEKTENLADEIKKLSDRLLMLSKLNAELESNINNTDDNKLINNELFIKDELKLKITNDINSNKKPEIKKKPDFLKNSTKLFNKSISVNDNQLSNLQNGTSTTSSSSSSSTSTSTLSPVSPSTNATETIMKLNNSDVIKPKIQTKTIINGNNKNIIDKPFDDSRNFTSTTTKTTTKTSSKIASIINKTSTNESERLLNGYGNKNENIPINIKRATFQKLNEQKTLDESYVNSAPWPITSRRTKFKINQMSRDVPISSPTIHSTIFMDDSGTATKDCLLQLLEKYNEKREKKSISTIGRHQSISTEWGITDNLENRSMNSINAFFHRHSSIGSSVKQIQAQIEGRKKP